MSMKFDASTAPEQLEYDLGDWGGPKGVIPEPTDAVLQAYLKFYDDLIETDTESQLQDEANRLNSAEPAESAPVKIVGDLPELPEAAANKPAPTRRRSLTEIILDDPEKARRTVDAVGELCQQSPTADVIWALPTRVRNAFANWIQNALVWGGPEGTQPVGTSGSPAGESGDGGTTSPAAT